MLQAGQVVNEYELLPLDSSGGSRRPLEEALTALRKVRPSGSLANLGQPCFAAATAAAQRTINNSSAWSPLQGPLHATWCTHLHAPTTAACRARCC